MQAGKTYLLTIENFMSIRELSLELTGTKGFCGPNGSGKTTVIKALQALMNGSASNAEQIRDGEKRSLIRLEEVLDGEVTKSVTRVQTAGGARLEAKDLDTDTPMSFLSRIIDRVAVNPVELISKDPVAYLKNHLQVDVRDDDLIATLPPGVDKLTPGKGFLDCDRIAKAYGEERVITGRELKHADEVVQELQQNLVTLPPAPITPEGLAAQEQQLVNAHAEVLAARKRIETQAAAMANTQDRVKLLERTVADAKANRTTTAEIHGNLDMELQVKLRQISENEQRALQENELDYEREKAACAAKTQDARATAKANTEKRRTDLEAEIARLQAQLAALDSDQQLAQQKITEDETRQAHDNQLAYERNVAMIKSSHQTVRTTSEQDVGKRRTTLATELAKLDAEIDGAQARLRESREQLEGMQVEATTGIEQKEAKLATDRQHVDAMKRELMVWQNLEARHKQVEARVAERNKKAADYELLDTLFKHYAYELPKRLLERCALPIVGMEFRNNELYVEQDGAVRHIDQLSTAQRVLVAIKLGIALAKGKGHVAICFDGIESLDANYRREFLQAAQDSGIAVIYTRCGTPEHDCETSMTAK